MTPTRAVAREVVARWHRESAAEGFVTDRNLSDLLDAIDAALQAERRAACELVDEYVNEPIPLHAQSNPWNLGWAAACRAIRDEMARREAGLDPPQTVV